MPDLRRNLHSEVLTSLSEFRVVSIVGARQAGKSTLAKAVGIEVGLARFLSFDDQATLEAAQRDASSLLNDRAQLTIVDEIQRAPEMILAIKRIVDSDRRPGQFLLTGSANLLSLPLVGETLTGRVRPIELHPFSQGEIEGREERFIDRVFSGTLNEVSPAELSRDDYIRRFFVGGFPDVVLNETLRRDIWFESYLATSIDNLRELKIAERAVEFRDFFDEVANQNGGLMVYEHLARRLDGIAEQTIKRYLALLEAVFLLKTVPAWGRAEIKTASKSPKVFLGDSGLACSLNRYQLSDVLDTLSPSVLDGQLVETFVRAELQKQQGWNTTTVKIRHFRNHAARETKEVDFILESAHRQIVGLEVKASSVVRAKDFLGLDLVADKLGEKFVGGYVLYFGTDVLQFGPKLWAMPISALWSA